MYSRKKKAQSMRSGCSALSSEIEFVFENMKIVWPYFDLKMSCVFNLSKIIKCVILKVSSIKESKYLEIKSEWLAAETFLEY